jgi:hypothetical protein
MSALYYAALIQTPSIIKMFLKGGERVNMTGKGGETSIHVLAKYTTQDCEFDDLREVIQCFMERLSNGEEQLLPNGGHTIVR